MMALVMPDKELEEGLAILRRAVASAFRAARPPLSLAAAVQPLSAAP